MVDPPQPEPLWVKTRNLALVCDDFVFRELRFSFIIEARFVCWWLEKTQIFVWGVGFFFLEWMLYILIQKFTSGLGACCGFNSALSLSFVPFCTFSSSFLFLSKLEINGLLASFLLSCYIRSYPRLPTPEQCVCVSMCISVSVCVCAASGSLKCEAWVNLRCV